MMTEPSQNDLKARRHRVLVTAWIRAGVAAAVFTAFVLSGVLGQ